MSDSENLNFINGVKQEEANRTYIQTFKDRLEKSRSQSGAEWKPIMGYQLMGKGSNDQKESELNKTESENYNKFFTPRNVIF